MRNTRHKRSADRQQGSASANDNKPDFDPIKGNASPLDIQIRMTWFRSRGGTEKTDLDISLRRLQQMIEETSAEEKARLPWITLADYGDHRTELREGRDGKRHGRCLRNLKNVLASTGAFADYDGEVMQMAEAVKIAKDAGLVAIFYETPSSTPDKPRWRAGFPYLKEQDAEGHYNACARINGLYDGILDQGFFDRSRGFYYGSVDGKPPVKTALVRGDYYADEPNPNTDVIGPMGKRRSNGQTGFIPGEVEQDLDLIDIDWAIFEGAVMAIPNNRKDNPKSADRDYWFKIGCANAVYRRPFKFGSHIPVPPIHDSNGGDLWEDHHTHNLRMFLEIDNAHGGWGLKVADRDLNAAVETAARQNRFHPVREYLTALKWDGVPRVSTLWQDYLGAPDDAYHRETAEKWMTAAVGRAFEPGLKFDFCPILEGAQGKRKSTFLRTLAKREAWFGPLRGNFDEEQKIVEQLQGRWIVEMQELSTLHRSEVEDMKAFLSEKKSVVRLA